MPLGQGIVEVLRAIPPRIEVAGHGPTLRITAGSFDAALADARERLDDPVVLDCELRHRFWPRVTLIVTTDQELAATAPALEVVRQRAVQQEEAARAARVPAHRAAPGTHRAEPEPEEPSGQQPAGQGREGATGTGLAMLEEIFADQETARHERAGRIPQQRRDAD